MLLNIIAASPPIQMLYSRPGADIVPAAVSDQTLNAAEHKAARVYFYQAPAKLAKRRTMGQTGSDKS